VFLEVRADNERAQRLYRWWGFTEVGIRRGYYQPSGTDAIVMRLDLPAAASPAAPGSPAGPGSSAAPGSPAVPGGATAGPRASDGRQPT
jgi:hypothetical protein